MTIKGIARSCLGDVFESGEELNRLAESYHKCWSEIEVCTRVASVGLVIYTCVYTDRHTHMYTHTHTQT